MADKPNYCQQENENSIYIRDKSELDRLHEIVKKKYTVLSSKDLINLDKTICREPLHTLITKFLWNGEFYIIHTPFHTLKKLSKLDEKILSFETNLGCKFVIYYKQIAKEDYFLKSKTPPSTELHEKLANVDKSLYTIQKDELFIKDIYLDDFIRAVSQHTASLRPQ